MAASLDLGDSRFVDYNRRRYNGQWRLHAYSSDFDLSFDDLRKSVMLFHSQDQVTGPGRERLDALLVQARRQFERRESPEARDALVDFQGKALDTRLVPGEEAGSDLAWDARLVVVQIEREAKRADAAKSNRSQGDCPDFRGTRGAVAQ